MNKTNPHNFEPDNWPPLRFVVQLLAIILLAVAMILIGIICLPKKAHASPCGTSLGPGESCDMVLKIPLHQGSSAYWNTKTECVARGMHSGCAKA